MLIELLVRNLGVIPDLALTFGEGMTAVTGETGAGKTLVVEAIDLLLGGRAETSLVAAGAAEARVDGRFVRGKGDSATEVVLTRVIPRDGRSRAYINGHPAPVTQLVEEGSRFVDLHGQHGHQSLLRVGEQRAALDAFGGVSLTALHEARETLRTLIGERNALGGDERARVREIDLLRFQVEELAAADLQDPLEDKTLEQEEDLLADALAHRSAAATAVEALSEDGGARDVVATALAAIANRTPYAALAIRMRALSAELADIAGELRGAGESIDDDPARLGAVRARRQRLQELRRKYGEDLAAVMAYSNEVSQRLDDLVRHDHRAAAIDGQIDAARAKVLSAGAKIVKARTSVAPGLSAAITKRLADLAMPKALFSISVSPIGEDGDGEVQFLLAANPGAPANPLAKVASGGELARVMLALRLALLEGRELVDGDPPDTLVFDEVDAGIGGQAATAVGLALAELALGRQVMVVTHLPQVAAFADQQAVVAKDQQQARTVTTVSVVNEEARIRELARMLSGSPESETAREHARELLRSSARTSGAKRKVGATSIDTVSEVTAITKAKIAAAIKPVKQEKTVNHGKTVRADSLVKGAETPARGKAATKTASSVKGVNSAKTVKAAKAKQ
jgi:DNA repair protein RecN (Recombination protein N)